MAGAVLNRLAPALLAVPLFMIACRPPSHPVVQDVGAEASTDGSIDSGSSSSDAEVSRDGTVAPDGAGDSDGLPPTAREAVFSSSGGGKASSEGYRLRLSIGAPQPAGTAKAPSGTTLKAGPGAAGL